MRIPVDEVFRRAPDLVEKARRGNLSASDVDRLEGLFGGAVLDARELGWFYQDAAQFSPPTTRASGGGGEGPPPQVGPLRQALEQLEERALDSTADATALKATLRQLQSQAFSLLPPAGQQELTRRLNHQGPGYSDLAELPAVRLRANIVCDVLAQWGRW